MRTIKFQDIHSYNNEPNLVFSQVGQFVTYASETEYITAKGEQATSGDVFYNTTTKTIFIYFVDRWLQYTPNGLICFATEQDFESYKTPNEGNIYYDTTEKRAKVYNGSQWLGLGSGGSGVIVTLYDSSSQTLPTGTSYTCDSVPVVDGDIVFFKHLNKAYKVSGVGISLQWQEQAIFSNGTTISDGEALRVLKGTVYKNQLILFNDGSYTINDLVRYFNNEDYYEQSNLVTVTLLANSTDDIFSVNLNGSENWDIDYSILSSSGKETGKLIITSDGIDAVMSRYEANTSDTNIDLFVTIVGSELKLKYTNNNNDDATIKLFYKRWANNNGGPAGVPSYSGNISSSVEASGDIKDIQFKGNDSKLAGDSAFQWDANLKELSLNGYILEKLTTITLNDNVTTAETAINLGSYSKAIIDYSIDRNSNSRVGRLLVISDGTNTSLTDDFNQTSDVGITFTSELNGSDLLIKYTSDNQGVVGTFKTGVKKWQ